MARLAARILMALALLGLTFVSAASTVRVQAQEVPPPSEIVLRLGDLPPGFAEVRAPASVLPDGIARQAAVEFHREAASGPATIHQTVQRFDGRDAAEYGPRFRDLMIRRQGFEPVEGGDEGNFALTRTQDAETGVVVGHAVGDVLVVTTVAGAPGTVSVEDAEQFSGVAQARLPEPGSMLVAANLSAAAPADGGITLAGTQPRSTYLSYPRDASGRGFRPVTELPGPPTIDVVSLRQSGPRGESEIAALMPEPVVTQRAPGFPNDPKEYVSAVKPMLDQFWFRTFQANGRSYRSADVLYVREGDETPDVSMLIADLSAAGHVYVPELELILISEPAIYSELYATPDWKPRAYVIVTSLAHEWGHHIQHLLGVVDAKGTIDSLSPDTQPLTSREVELQADCYAGLFSRYARDTGWLSDHDLAEAMAVRERVGDFEVSNPGHHGTPEQRREWFLRGFIHYSMRACETW